MQRWKLILEYDGGSFYGWQSQKDAVSVQGTVEEAIKSFSGEDVRLHVAGRTDAGVHALGQVAHADIEKTTDAETVRDAINYYMRGKSVVVLNAEAVAADFHARFSATSRAYMYRVINRRIPLTIEKNHAVHMHRSLQLAPMQDAAKLLIGHHDFSTFRAQNCQSKSPMKTMDEARIEQQGDEFRFYFSAKSFLYHQVRNMVGTLFLIGTGQWQLEDFKKAFEARDRKAAGPTAPPQGLYFLRATY